MANPLIKPIKIALAKKYGYQNVSVKNGTGTAWGWVKINLTTKKPELKDCTCNPSSWEQCSGHRSYFHDLSMEVEREAVLALSQENLKPYTYSDDMGGDNSEITVQLDY